MWCIHAKVSGCECDVFMRVDVSLYSREDGRKCGVFALWCAHVGVVYLYEDGKMCVVYSCEGG